MLRLAALLAVCSAACGDNVFELALGSGAPLAPGKDLVLVAHQDDDLLFMQPDVIEAVQRGEGVTNVYVTAGNGTKGARAADIRYEGLKAAYGAAAHDTAWDCGWIEIVGHAAQHCRLAAERVSLVFLAYPDGGEEGQEPGSLLQLWDGTVQRSTTVADRPAVYDQAALIQTVAAIIDTTQPDVIRTLDVTSNHGHDHVDHMIVGALALIALGTIDRQPAVIAYRGYDTAGEPRNKIGPIFGMVRDILGRYEACATQCGPCGTSCASIDPAHDTWLGRRYAIGFHRVASGQLATQGQCLFADGTLGACTTAPVWSLDARGSLATGGACLTVGADGSLSTTTCVGGPAQHVFLDDEGHIWSALPPPAQKNMEFAHLDCLTPSADGTAATARLCGKDHTPAWQVLPPLVTTPRSTTGLAATGRAVRLGDLTGDGFADLCTVMPAGLVCSPGDGTGHFGATIWIGDLPIDPDSLAIGDVDGDGLADACGRASGGTICALAANAFAGAQVSTMFGDGDARADTAASLQVSAGAICGADARGVTCTPALGATASLLSAWPEQDALVWPGDFDGDGAPDWCAMSSAGPACGLAAETAMTTAGVPWLFSQGGTPETVPPDAALTAVADIDGDGAADLCAVGATSQHGGDGADANAVVCAHSQGRGFGPLATLLEAPSPPGALWLGDLDGDGRADACVDLGDTIACALVP